MFSVDSSPEQSKIMGNDIFGSSVTSTINRKKPLEGDGLQTELKRCLTTSDLTVFGYGQMMGSGLYVVTGIVLHDIAGPAAFLCFLLSGLVALLNALCYAECATLIPNAGSTYAYTYVTMGEIWAFLVGWNIALDYVMGGAAVARGFSGAISSLLNERYANWSVENLGEIYSFGSRINYPDLIAVLCVIIVAIFNIIGAKFTIMMNNVGSFVNTCCILVIVIAGMVVTKHYGWEMFMSSTAFIPFGVEGVVAGTAVCFNAYQGYEAIAVAGEEATNPRRSIPIATVTSVLFTTLVYVLSAFTLSRMVPYNQVDTIAPFPQAFAATGFTWIKTVVAIGSIVGISNALISDLFSGPRTIYAMATDGLVWKPLGVVNVVTQIPLYATIACAAVTITVALFLDSHALVEITSIGVLLSAFMVSVNVLLLRYQTMQESPFKLHELRNKELQNRDDTALLSSAQEPEDIGNLKRKYRYLYYLRDRSPDQTTKTLIISMTASQVVFAAMVTIGMPHVMTTQWWALTTICISIILMLGSLLLLSFYQHNTSFTTFQVPLVPLVPSVSMLISLILMMHLQAVAWVRLAIWSVIGLLVYAIYGVKHSNLHSNDD